MYSYRRPFRPQASSSGYRGRPSFGGRRPSFGGRGRFNAKTPDVHSYIRRATVKTSPSFTVEIKPSKSFSELPISDKLKSNILSHGYTKLTPIQEEGIQAILDGKDVIGIANTGTGKTAAFLIPLIEKVSKDRGYQALIITPTRELALQIRDEMRKFSNMIPVNSAFCIGQSSMRDQIYDLRRNPNFVIGTPGRLKDLIERRVLKLETFKMIVLDEVDQMLDMGFINDIRHIISFLPKVRQSLFFSATVSPQINTLIQSFVKNPITISVKTQETLSDIKQEVVSVLSGKSKAETLHNLLRKEELKKVLVFMKTKRGAEKLSYDLFMKGFKVASIHGDKPQFKRQQAIRMFKEDVVRILVATDVAARGLDIANITHVINYDAPATYEDYIHRIGRTGRANKKGVALTFVEG